MELKNVIISIRDLADNIDEYSDNIKSLCEAFNKNNIQELATLREIAPDRLKDIQVTLLVVRQTYDVLQDSVMDLLDTAKELECSLQIEADGGETK